MTDTTQSPIVNAVIAILTGGTAGAIITLLIAIYINVKQNKRR